MSELLSLGTELEFADYVDWNETTNIKDYEVVFVDLLDLEKRKDEFLHSYVPAGYKRQYNLPNPKDDLRLLTSGGDLIVCLPTTTSVKPSEDQEWEPEEPIPDDALIRPGTPILNLFSWLPFGLEVSDEPGKSVDEGSIDDGWKWYFDGQFSWEISFKNHIPDEDSVEYQFHSLVSNRYGEALAAEIMVKSKGGMLPTGSESNQGTVYLLPLVKTGHSFDDVAEKVVDNFYPEVDLETVGRHPDWLSEYAAPREKELLGKIRELEDELEEERLRKDLLWEYDDELENAVRSAFKDAGLTVGGEVKNRRDGSIELDDRVILLEIKGQEGDVSEENISQLIKWVDRDGDEFERDVTGLLVVNHRRLTEPNEREFQLDQERYGMLDRNGLQVVTSLELFKMLRGLEAGDISEADVVEKLKSEEIVVQFDEVESPF
jgi:hypothetical protein